jgi:Spy/CpxP family protein refolding chaperone
MIRLVGAATFAVTLAAGAPASARSARDAGIGGGAFFGAPQTLHALDLSGEQARAVRAVLQSHAQSLHRLAADERATKRAIEDKLVAPGPLTEHDLDGLLAQELQTRSALARERLVTAIAVRDQLTPAQIDRVASIREGLAQARVHLRPFHPEPHATK